MTDAPVPAAAESGSTRPRRLPLVFDHITFEGGKLWRPRYGSLVDYRRVPGLQIEPAFQVRQENLEVEITLEIEEGQGVTFVREDDRVKCRAIDDPEGGDIPGLVKAQWESERSCTLVLNPSAVSRTAFDAVLRIFCQAEKAVRDRWTKGQQDLAEVEGGLYVAILYRPPREHGRPPVPALTLKGPANEPPGRSEIRILHIVEGRPVFDLFRRTSLARAPEGLELEPAFRAWEGEATELNLTLDIAGLRWMSSGGEAVVVPSDNRRLQQLKTKVSRNGKVCNIRWLPQAGRAVTAGGVFSFDFTVVPTPALERKLRREHPDPREALAAVAIDPTVIEPPSCTPDGVCSPPGGERNN